MTDFAGAPSKKWLHGARILGGVLVGLGICLAALAVGPEPSAAQGPRRALYEPPDGFAYIGMFMRLWDSSDQRVGDSRSFAQRYQDVLDNELGRKPPAIMLVPTVWQRDDGVPIPFEAVLPEIEKVTRLNGGKVVPYIKWNAQTGWDAGNPAYRGITSRDVAQGKLDDYIRDYARAVRDYGRPLFMSPVCAEFNGNYWRSCSPGADRTLSVNDFVAAWRRAVDIFRAEGVTNVAWVWNPIEAPAVQDFTPFWPGDDYVDWAGVDMYDDQPPANIEPPYQFALLHGKPFFLGEWGVRVALSTLTPEQQRDWLNGMFDVFESHLRIKAIVYYNYHQGFQQVDTARLNEHVVMYGGQVNYRPNVNDGDSRLLADSGAGFRSLFARRLAHRRYISVLQGIPTPVATASPALD
jgi:hypothetical protein